MERWDSLSFSATALDGYAICPVQSAQAQAAYSDLLKTTYAKLGFLEPNSEFEIVSPNATRFLLHYEAEHIGMYGLREVPSEHAHYAQWVPGFAGSQDRALEVHNFILTQAHRGQIGRVLMLHHAVGYALEHGYAYLVGIARYSALKFFVDAGAVPVYHPPLHLLGKSDLRDFVMYFDLRQPGDVDYLQQRAERLIHQICVLHALKTDFLSPQKRRRPRHS